MRLGPITEYVKELDYSINDRNKNRFFSAFTRFLPEVEYDDIDPYMVGIRPKLQGPEDEFRDFVICEESQRELPGFINLIGIESPGLTASLYCQTG